MQLDCKNKMWKQPKEISWDIHLGPLRKKDHIPKEINDFRY